MNLRDYYNKDRHTRKENKKYNEIMRKKYEKYKEAYHKGKIEYRTRAVEKYSFKEFKEAYEFSYKRTGGKGTLKEFLKEESFSELTEYAYDTKRENLKRNQAAYRAKQESGVPLTEGELLVLNTDANGNIHKIVAMFDKLGLAHVAFDSPGSAEK